MHDREHCNMRCTHVLLRVLPYLSVSYDITVSILACLALQAGKLGEVDDHAPDGLLLSAPCLHHVEHQPLLSIRAIGLLQGGAP